MAVIKVAETLNQILGEISENTWSSRIIYSFGTMYDVYDEYNGPHLGINFNLFPFFIYQHTGSSIVFISSCFCFTLYKINRYVYKAQF